MSAEAYPFVRPLLPGTLLRRYKRFFADIELDSGQVVVAHCPNTGPMSGVSQIGSAVYVSHQPDPRRKLAYTWEMIRVGSVWVGINTSLPNRLIQFGLEHDWFPELLGFRELRREVAYGLQGSKIDLLLGYPEHTAYVEVKNTTWSHGSVALFPDTVTTRGQKHLQELMYIAQQPRSEAVLLYVINRGDCTEFAPGDERDPVYGDLLRQALATGVKVLPYRFRVEPEAISCLGLARLAL